MISADALPWSRHLAGGSPWHRCDPRVRLLLSLALSALALASGTWPEFALLFALLWAVYRLSGTGWTTAWRGLRRFLVLFFFTALLQMFFTPGEPLLALPWAPAAAVTREGLVLSALIVARLAAVILVSANLIATTSPLELSRSLGWMLLPGRRLGLPVADLMLVLNLGFQFLPLLIEESQGLRLALESRGISLRHRRPAMRLRALSAWALAILSSVLERSQRQAVALEAKHFGRSGRLVLRFPPRSAESRRFVAGAAAGVLCWLLLRTLNGSLPPLIP